MEPIQVQVINSKRIYKQAKVRREIYRETIARRRDQMPRYNVVKLLTDRHGNAKRPFYPGDQLIPGKAVYAKEPVRR